MKWGVRISRANKHLVEVKPSTQSTAPHARQEIENVQKAFKSKMAKKEWVRLMEELGWDKNTPMPQVTFTEPKPPTNRIEKEK